MMDNFHFDMVCTGFDIFRNAMCLAFFGSGHSKVTHYKITEKNGLIFFWNNPSENIVGDPEAIAFPFKMNADGAADFAYRWLGEVTYPKQDQYTYHQNKGWKLYNNLGYVGNYRSSLIAVLPEWAEYSE